MAMKGLSKESMKPIKVKHFVIKTIRRYQSRFSPHTSIAFSSVFPAACTSPSLDLFGGEWRVLDVRMLPEFYLGWDQVSPTDACTLVSPVHGALFMVFCNVSDLIFKPSPVCSLFYLLCFRWWKIFSWIKCVWGHSFLTKSVDSPIRCFHWADKAMFFPFSFLTSPTSTFIPESKFRAPLSLYRLWLIGPNASVHGCAWDVS